VDDDGDAYTDCDELDCEDCAVCGGPGCSE
jgi:hypothetical protein